MCHWTLRIWKCGDSFFTKSSSCSVDRAIHDPVGLLNPLHPSIRPMDMPALSANGNRRISVGSTTTTSSGSSAKGSTTSTADTIAVPTIDLSLVGAERSVIGAQIYPRDAKTGEIVPIPMSEVGKASRINEWSGHQTAKCQVFEVVLQRKEATICPFCARSPRRRRLPPHARNCFGLS